MANLAGPSKKSAKTSEPETTVSWSNVPLKRSTMSMPMMMLSLIGIGLLAVAGYFVFMYIKMLMSPIAVPPLPPSPTPHDQVFFPPDLNMADTTRKTYIDPQYGFSLQYPEQYQIVKDKQAWPNAVLMLYKGGQSYDLVIEVWNSPKEYQAKYQKNLIVKQNKNKYFTLQNFNYSPEVDEIISSFEFINKDTVTQFCGGIAGIQCADGYHCVLDGNYPDAGGTCQK